MILRIGIDEEVKMLEDLLNAYDQVKQLTFKEKIKKLSLIDKMLIGTIVIGLIVISILCYRNILYATVFSIIYTLVLWGMIWLSEWLHNKKWQENIEKYKEALSNLKKLLGKYDLYEKNKIKQLIYKYKQDADEIEKAMNKWDDIYNRLKVSYIIPFVAFMAGKIGNDVSLNDIVVLAFFVALCLIVLRVIFYGIKAINIDMRNDPVGRRKRFAKKLQDLLDQDFEIMSEDLLQ